MTTELNALERETRDALEQVAEDYKRRAMYEMDAETAAELHTRALDLYALESKWIARIVDNERKAGVYYKTTAEALEAHTARVVGMVEESLAKPRTCSRCGKVHGDYAGGC